MIIPTKLGGKLQRLLFVKRLLFTDAAWHRLVAAVFGDARAAPRAGARSAVSPISVTVPTPPTLTPATKDAAGPPREGVAPLQGRPLLLHR
jgi:hypothetical protein